MIHNIKIFKFSYVIQNFMIQIASYFILFVFQTRRSLTSLLFRGSCSPFSLSLLLLGGDISMSSISYLLTVLHMTRILIKIKIRAPMRHKAKKLSTIAIINFLSSRWLLVSSGRLVVVEVEGVVL